MQKNMLLKVAWINWYFFKKSSLKYTFLWVDWNSLKIWGHHIDSTLYIQSPPNFIKFQQIYTHKALPKIVKGQIVDFDPFNILQYMH